MLLFAEINLRSNGHLAYELQDFMEKVGREVAEELLEPFKSGAVDQREASWLTKLNK